MQGINNKEDVRVDVIVPSYNAHKTLRRALLSVTAQSIADEIDVTVVDDCSPRGGYAEILAEFRPLLSVRELTLEEDVGPSLARQRALDQTRNPFIVFLDSDDTLAGPRSLEEMRAELLADESLGEIKTVCHTVERIAPGILHRLYHLSEPRVSLGGNTATVETCASQFVFLHYQYRQSLGCGISGGLVSTRTATDDYQIEIHIESII